MTLLLNCHQQKRWEESICSNSDVVIKAIHSGIIKQFIRIKIEIDIADGKTAEHIVLRIALLFPSVSFNWKYYLGE